jgi:DNA-binding NarL/FixJ family response regulator
MISVALVDDQGLIRAGLRALIDGEDGMVVVGEAADGAEGVELVRRTKADVVLMDISMPVLTGVDATRRIVADSEPGEHKVLVLTTYQQDENLFEALRAGASGFLAKDTDPDELLRAIRVVAAGEALLSPNVTRRLIDEFTRRPEPRTPRNEQLQWLTRREREVMALVALGLTNAEIADELVISCATAKTHVSRAMRKLHANDRAQLVVFAYASGLVQAAASPLRPGAVPA